MTFLWGRIGFLAIALVCAWHRCVDAQLLPTTDEFQVNSFTTLFQTGAHVAATTPGNFVVTWTSFEQDGDSDGIFARRFTSPATPVGTEALVNSYTTGDQAHVFVAASANGDFVVAWDSYYQDGSYTGLYAQRFSNGGLPLGTEFQVSTQTVGEQSKGSIAYDASGFVIVWEEYPDPENGGDSFVMGRRFDPNGVPQGTEFQINSPSTATGAPTNFVTTPSGFVVVWSDRALDGDVGGVVVRRIDSAGTPLGSEFVANTYTTGFQGGGHVGASADGSFVVVWQGETSLDSFGHGIIGQRFDSSGAPVGTEFVINTYTSSSQGRPSVAVSPTGEFVVVWESRFQDGSDYGVFLRSFKADGTPDSGDIQVNQFTTGNQQVPAIAALDERDVVVVWQSNGQDGSSNGVFGRRYRRAGDRISGKKLHLRESPAGPTENTLTFVSKDASLEPPQSAAEDPRCQPAGSGSASSGAKLRVKGDGGDFTIDLPCVNWSANADGTRYRYRDASGATCHAIVLRAGRLMKATCRGPQIAYDLGAAQGNVHVMLTTGDPSTNRKYCATFGPQSAATVIRDGSDGRSYRAVQAGAGVCQ